MRTMICAATALLLTAALPAQAADKPLLPPPEKKAAAKGPYDWTGFYAGVNGGYASGDTKWSSGAPDGASHSFGSSTPTFGAHAGYNYQLGNGVLFGGESDLSGTH